MAVLNNPQNSFITRLQLLTSLSDDALGEIEAACSAGQPFEAHTDIVCEGSATDSVHFVMEGWCCRYRILPDGRRQLPALLLPGDICDLDGLLLRRIHFGVATITPCTVASIPRLQLHALMDSNREIRDVFWWLLSAENSIATEWIVGLGQRSAEERLAHLLCELLLRLTPVQLAPNNSFTLPLTLHELGELLGISAVHIARTLQDLRAKGIIRFDQGHITIFNWPELKKISDFTSSYLHLEGLRLENNNFFSDGPASTNQQSPMT